MPSTILGPPEEFLMVLLMSVSRYMAPEVLNRQEYSNKADIWSLGCVMFELTTLNHPTYEQDRRIFFEWIPQHYSANMVSIIRSCLSESASSRPSPRELLVKLTSPMLRIPSIQEEFRLAMQWFDTQMAGPWLHTRMWMRPSIHEVLIIGRL
jgi:serine/threonine protein kinase